MMTKLLFSFPVVLGWGGDGHAVVTRVAMDLVSEQSFRFVQTLIGDDMIEASQWADTADASERYPESDDYHFSHTPYQNCQPFVLQRDCGFRGKEGLCIVTGLAEAIDMVIDPDVSRENRTDALKFVLHFMADIHQPLHTGFREDAGGTAIDIRNEPNATLHKYWDYGLIENYLQDKSWNTMSDAIFNSVTSRGRQFVNRIESQHNITSVLENGTRSSLIEYISTIASDTSLTVTCKLAYMNEKSEYIASNDMLSEDYMKRGKIGVQIQLSKAAVRLALLVDAMATVHASRVAARNEASRAIRVERLFDRMQKEAAEKAVHDPLAGNRFAILSMDFEVDEYLYDSFEDVVVLTGLSKKDRKALRAAQKAQEARRLKNKLRRDERKRIARMVDGIDLNSLVLVKRGDHYWITLESLASKKTILYMKIHVKFSNQDEPIDFYLDNRVFVKVPSDSFINRMFKAIKNEDDEFVDAGTASVEKPVASSTSMMMQMMTAMFPQIRETQKTLFDNREAHFAQFKHVEERLLSDKEADLINVKHWKKYEKDMIAITFPGGTSFISTYSLCRNPKRTKFVLNQFGFKGIGAGAILIDQEFFDDQITDGVAYYVRRSFFSKDRTRILLEKNPGFGTNMKKFIDAAGLGIEDVDFLQLAQFKQFGGITRTDKPYLRTIVVDFAPRTSLLTVGDERADMILRRNPG